MSSTIIQNIQTCIQTNDSFGFYYINDTHHLLESTEDNNTLFICYPLLIDIENNILIAIFSNTDLDDIKTILNKDTFSTSFNPTEGIESTALYSFNLEKMIEFTDYSDDAWDKYSSCEGCRYGHSNQQGHMDYGGCMYSSEY